MNVVHTTTAPVTPIVVCCEKRRNAKGREWANVFVVPASRLPGIQEAIARDGYQLPKIIRGSAWNSEFPHVSLKDGLIAAQDYAARFGEVQQVTWV